MNKLDISQAVSDVFELFRKCNKYIDLTMPWVLYKEKNIGRLGTVLYNLIECIRIGTILMRPFIPSTCDKIFKQINTQDISFEDLEEFGYYENGTKVNAPEVLFERIEK